MIELRNLSAGYGEKPVLTGIDLEFPPGTVTMLLGPNGSGKTTLLKAIVGLARVTGGEIRVDGKTDLHQKELAQAVAYLPQSRQVPEITVENLVLHGRFPYLSYPRRYRPEDLTLARQAMDRVGIGALAGEMLPRLSGGTRQKAYIAMALAQDTPTILLDEPATYLDISHQLQLMSLCRELADRGKAVVLVMHDLALALEWADRIALLWGGGLLARGSVANVLASGKLEKAFGVKIHCVTTPRGKKYDFERV